MLTEEASAVTTKAAPSKRKVAHPAATHVGEASDVKTRAAPSKRKAPYPTAWLARLSIVTAAPT